MTETLGTRFATSAEFTEEVLVSIEAARDAGARAPEDIATALNRSGISTWRGHQWDAERVLEFLACPDVQRIIG